jgi:hypothetical protein
MNETQVDAELDGILALRKSTEVGAQVLFVITGQRVEFQD